VRQPRHQDAAATPTTTTAPATTTPAASGGASPDPAPRGRPRDATVDRKILAVTFRQLVDVGYGALSIEAVAAEAGVAKTTIYRRYPTKAGLAVAALNVEVPFPPLPVELGAREALARFVHQAIGMLVESGAIRILGSLLVEEAREPGLLNTFRARLLGPRREQVEEMLLRGIERGEIRPDIDPLVVTEMIAGAIFGHHAILGLTGTDEWVEKLIDHVWAAIATRASDPGGGRRPGT
jgi:AcrR family transcriptional regulator